MCPSSPPLHADKGKLCAAWFQADFLPPHLDALELFVGMGVAPVGDRHHRRPDAEHDFLSY